MAIGDLIQTADWKKEKHAPVIDCPDKVEAGESFVVKVGVGKEIAHPNTAEHHISWITLYFQPEGGKFPYQVAHFEFNAHGEGGVFTAPKAGTAFTADKSGTLYALSFCNLHGLWENSKAISVG